MRRFTLVAAILAVVLAIGSAQQSFSAPNAVPLSIGISVDRGAGSTYEIGDPIQICYTVSRAGNIRISLITSDGTSIILQTHNNGSGGCINRTVGAPTGAQELFIETLDGTPYESATTSYTVREGAAVTVSISTDQPSYNIGDPIYWCYTVSRPVHVRVWNIPLGQSGYMILDVDESGHGSCTTLIAAPPSGEATLRIEAIEGGQVKGSAQTTYSVNPPADPRVSVNLQLSPAQAKVNDDVVATFTIKNQGRSRWSVAQVCVMQSGGGGFPCDQNVTIEPGASRSFRQHRTFSQQGTYVFQVMWRDLASSWQAVPTMNNVSGTATLQVAPSGSNPPTPGDCSTPGNVCAGIINVRTYIDTYCNGILDLPLPGVSVTMTLPNGTRQTAVSDAHGDAYFIGVYLAAGQTVTLNVDTPPAPTWVQAAGTSLVSCSPSQRSLSTQQFGVNGRGTTAVFGWNLASLVRP